MRPPQQPKTGDQVLDRIISGESMQPSTDDLAFYIGQIYYLVKDDEINQQLKTDPAMRPLMPVLSHLLRTSNLDDKTIKIAKLRWRIACRLQLLCQKNPTVVSLAKFNSWLIYGYAALEDAKRGWRGRLVTEKIKTYRVEVGEQKRRRFLGLGR